MCMPKVGGVMYATFSQPTCKVALSSLVFFFFEVHVDIHYVRVTVVNGLRIMTIV